MQDTGFFENSRISSAVVNYPFNAGRKRKIFFFMRTQNERSHLHLCLHLTAGLRNDRNLLLRAYKHSETVVQLTYFRLVLRTEE